MTTCTYDSGSATGCAPACERRATHAVVYRNGSYGPFTAPVCPDHLAAMQARAYPGVVRVQSVGCRVNCGCEGQWPEHRSACARCGEESHLVQSCPREP